MSITQNQIHMIHRHRQMFVQNFVQKSQSIDVHAFFKGFEIELM